LLFFLAGITCHLAQADCTDQSAMMMAPPLACCTTAIRGQTVQTARSFQDVMEIALLAVTWVLYMKMLLTL